MILQCDNTRRRVYRDAVYHDLSLGEIAEERGITRQGVHDMIRRCDRILQGYEDKLHLVERFARARKTIGEIERLTMSAENEADMRENLQDVRRLCRELMNEL